MSTSLAALGITPAAIQSYDQRIPRYTSYPTAPYWTPAFGPNEFADHIRTTSPSGGDLSLYVHIPFCGKRCLFCGCNVIITQKADIASEYLDSLQRELDLVRSCWRGTGRVIQLHLGGGTPNYLTIPEMTRLLAMLRAAFPFATENETSIEVDPRVATPEYISALGKDLGFSRISFGVQDFHDETQHAIGREQTLDVSIENVEAARRAGFRSVNIDLIYGLPMQTAASWSTSLDHVIRMRPDRIALYNFAYLPSRLAHQRVLDPASLPSPDVKLDMFAESHDRLTEAGYAFIGMDHYALTTDSLAVAQEQGTLRRNFMGYTTLRGTDMLGFGTSAISNYRGAFAQNVKKLSQYNSMLAEGLLPVERGLLLSREDEVRQYVIEELMCNGVLRAQGRFAEDITRLIRTEAEPLARLQSDQLIVMSPDSVSVTMKGRVFLRNIAVVFDEYMKQPNRQPEFSRAV